MNKLFLSLMAMGCSLASLAGVRSDFAVDTISTQVGNFQLDSINLSSPLNYYLSRAWVRSTGKQRLWHDISTSKFNFDANAADEVVDSDMRSYIANETIDRIVVYRDSVAAIITHTEGEDLVFLNYCWIEHGRWVNGGQGMAHSLEQAHETLLKQLPYHYANLPRIARIEALPQSEVPFVEFLLNSTSSPEHFLLDMLESHRLVINGEFHRRKVSWDMLKRLIALPEFPDKVGHIFMELPSWCQPKMDSLMASDLLQKDTLLGIFREEQLNGWWDRGEFEFICQLWALNRRLPADKKVKVILADYQIPYSGLTEGNTREAEDRNTHMADVIERTLAASDDARGNLFLVGCGHAYKSNQAGFASAASGRPSEKTAAAQLADRLGASNVFTVFQHGLSGDNAGRNKRPLRGGIFDKAFEAVGNRPVGFALAGSPFGAEPFDGIYEIKYKVATGSFADNFDGYLFLHPVVGEPVAEPLTEIFTDAFVEEMKRRASVLGLENARGLWFGVSAPDMTKEHIVDVLTRE